MTFLGTYTSTDAASTKYYKVGVMVNSFYGGAKRTWYYTLSLILYNSTQVTSMLYRSYFQSSNQRTDRAYETGNLHLKKGSCEMFNTRGGYIHAVIYWKSTGNIEIQTKQAYNGAVNGYTGSYSANSGAGTQTDVHVVNPVKVNNYSFFHFPVNDATGTHLLFYNSNEGTSRPCHKLVIGEDASITQTTVTLVGVGGSDASIYYAQWGQINSTTYYTLRNTATQWEMAKFTFDESANTLTRTSTTGLQTLTNLDNSVINGNSVDKSMANYYLQDGTKTYMWHTDDGDLPTYVWDAESQSVAALTGDKSFNTQLASVTESSLRVGKTWDGAFFFANDTNVKHKIVDAEAFNANLKRSVDLPLLATSTAEKNATANFMISPGLTSSVTLPSSHYQAKEDTFYKLDGDTSTIDTSTIKSVQRGYSSLASAASGNITIAAVNNKKSELNFSFFTNYNDHRNLLKMTLSSGTTIAWQRWDSGGTHYVEWEVLEYV